MVTRTCARVDKTGLATIAIEENDLLNGDIPSIVFMCLAVAEFSVRKAFTLTPQMQGALDQSLEYIMDNMLCKPNSDTRWDWIAMIYPVEQVMSCLPVATLSQQLQLWLQLQVPVAKFLESQWEKGVSNCASNGMMVPRAGTVSVNSGGWNMVAGCWNNIVRFLHALCRALKQEPPLSIKCMKLTAGDQMQWASMVNKPEPVDVQVFVQLALKRNITAWNIVLGKVACSIDDIARVCSDLNVDYNKWLGTANTRRTKKSVVAPHMICGCVVPTDEVVMNVLKSMGAFGYKPQQ